VSVTVVLARRKLIFLVRLGREHRAQFSSDPNLRERAGRYLTALLPPKFRRRGRPGRPDVTKAIRLLRKFRREYPHERGEKRSGSGFIPRQFQGTSVTEPEQNDGRQQLRERVRWRQRSRKRRQART
jgi:hypothetical protein